MSQHGNEVNNDEDESASVFANNKSVLDFLIKKIPSLIHFSNEPDPAYDQKV